MYEKPQFLTPDGYRRLPKGPGKKGSKKTALKAEKNVAVARSRMKKMSSKQVSISPEAAKAIALAIKAMLGNK